MTRFSIIIPVYNVAPYLRACLDSVCAAVAKVKDAEIICVDDGSTDGSGTLLDELAGEMSGSGTAENMALQLKVIHQRNAGVSAARNRGLEMATGEWISFADADDLLAPMAFADAMTLIKRHPDADLVVLGKLDFRNGELPDAASKVELAERIINRRDCLLRAVEMVSLVQMFISRDVCADLWFARYCMGEDRVFVHQVIRRVSKAVLTDEVGYFYRIHGASISHSRMTLRKRWDDFRHVIHVLAILLATPGAGGRMRLRYVRATVEKALGLFGG